MSNTLPALVSHLTDEQLVSRLTADRTAMAELYNRHSAGLLAVGRAILHSVSDAEDTVHDVFVKLSVRAAQFRPGSGTVRSWLNAAMRNACIDRRRRAGLRRRRADEVANVFAFAIRQSHDAEATVRSLDADRALQAVATLTPVQRETIERLYCAGLSCSELARLEGVPVGTVKSRAARALESLRSAWRRAEPELNEAA